MTGKSQSQGKITILIAVVVLVILIGLLQLSFWSDRKAIEVEGPSRIVKGPRDLLYIQIDRKIVKVSPNGDVLHVMDLDADAAISEPIADFFVENDGRLLIARKDSQLLQYYSPEGKLIRTHARVPSELVDGAHFCKFSKDAATGMLYFADTSHHRIQIYRPDEKEVNTIVVPSGSAQVTDHRQDFDEAIIASPDTPLYYPNGMTFDRDKLFATDTGNHRIIVFYPDGSLNRIIPLMQEQSSNLTNPFRLARINNTIYVILRGPNFLGGKVAAFDQITGQPMKFWNRKTTDPWDVLPRPDDVLVADRESLSILRYTHTGEPLGTFGMPSLQGLYADRQIARKTYQWLRTGSLVGMLVVLGWLLFASRKQRVDHEMAGKTLHKPVMTVQNILGPMGSVRRSTLLLIPGLGQIAAGRFLRATTVLIVLLYFISLVAFSWFEYFSGEATSLPVLITVLFFTYAIWMSVVLDGVQLSGRPADVSRGLSSKRVIVAFTAPLITVCAVCVTQFTREAVVKSNPEISLYVQSILRSLIDIFGGDVSPFAVALPASVVFGWGGAGAGMIGVLAWQASAGTRRILTGAIYGFLSGITSWVIVVLLVGSRLGSLLYMPPLQGFVLSAAAYLFFRNEGMPLLVVPVATAGAWLGNFLKLFLGTIDKPLIQIVPRSIDPLWAGAITRVEFVAVVAFFIHISIWVAWNSASARPVGTAASYTS